MPSFASLASSCLLLAAWTIECGQPLRFSGLLASMAALAPNPAATTAVLTLVAATQPGTVLALTDALGRRVWQRPVAAGQTSRPVPLARPAGGPVPGAVAGPGRYPPHLEATQAVSSQLRSIYRRCSFHSTRKKATRRNGLFACGDFNLLFISSAKAELMPRSLSPYWPGRARQWAWCRC